MPPLVAIVGETGSGKSALAIQLAKQFNGEIISADSRTVYTGMDIGTAKPTMTERQGIRHYGFDVAMPNESFNAYDFQQLATAAITDISRRDKLAIMVGGTGLYVDAVLYQYTFRPRPDPALRSELQLRSTDELRQLVVGAGRALPQNGYNPRHLARLLEAGPPPMQPKVLRANTLVLGLSVDRETLRQRITQRVEDMVAAGLASEVRTLRQQYGNVEALQTPGYKAFSAYVAGDIDLSEAKRQFVQADLQLAKRQRTWFKRNKAIHWLTGGTATVQAEQLVASFLRGEQ